MSTPAAASLLPLEAVVLEDPAAGSRAVVAPSRGGMLTRFDVGGRAVVFMDEATLADTQRNVRGGNPVLFPSPGRLEGDRYATRGAAGELKQHGLARLAPWSLVSSTTREAVVRLVADDATRRVFPWSFALTIRYTLDGARVSIATTVENRTEGRPTGDASDRMPFGLGFHPYFQVASADKARTVFETSAIRAYDNVSRSVVDVVSPLDLTRPEVDLRLFGHAGGRAELRLADGRRVEITADPAFGHWVIWTLEGRDFVCVEPWTSPPNALNQDVDLLELGPGESRTLTMTIALLSS